MSSVEPTAMQLRAGDQVFECLLRRPTRTVICRLAYVADILGMVPGEQEILDDLVRLGVETLAVLPRGDQSPGATKDVTAAAILRLETESGLAVGVMGSGTGALVALHCAMDGLAHCVVAHEPALTIGRDLDELWDEESKGFRFGDRTIEASQELPSELRVLDATIRGRTLPCPGLVIRDHGFRHTVDDAWLRGAPSPSVELAFDLQAHSDSPTEAARAITKPTVEWLGQLSTRELASEPRRLVTPAPAASLARGQIFISYRHDDAEQRAYRIRDYLRAAGFRSFLDRDSLSTGNIKTTIERSITNDCSGAVLIVTEELKKSTFVKNYEVPLLRRAESAGFQLAIDNAIPHPDKPGHLDAEAPDRILGLTQPILVNNPQFDLTEDSESKDGMKTFIHRLLKQRLGPLRGRLIVIDFQTYDVPDDVTLDHHADLRIRNVLNMTSMVHGQPSDLPEALERFQLTLPLISQVLHATRPKRIGITHAEDTDPPETIHVTGGALSSAAFALGGLLVTTRTQVSVTIADRYALPGAAWGSKDHTRDPRTHAQELDPLTLKNPDTNSGSVAIFLNTIGRENDLFEDFISKLRVPIAAAAEIRVTGGGKIQSPEGLRLANDISKAMRDFAEKHAASHILLCAAINFPLAVLVGQRMNTFGVTCYDLVSAPRTDDPCGPVDRWYHRMLTLSHNDSMVCSVNTDPIPQRKPDAFG